MKPKYKFLFSDRTAINRNVKSAFFSVLPVAIVILLLLATVIPVDSGRFLAFLTGVFLVVFGMGMFTFGADTAMTFIGKYVSASVIKTKKLWLILPIFFVVGLFITVSEPDLQVLAGQLSDTVKPWFLLITVGVGVGVFLVIAVLRTVLNVKLNVVLIIGYLAVFVLSIFVPENFKPLSFDSGGVTTGPMSVPFIMALGIGVASLRTDKGAQDDGFGFTALCSIGPVIAVMILGIIFKPVGVTASAGENVVVESSRDLFSVFLGLMPKYLKEVAIAVIPIFAIFFIVKIFGGKIAKSEFIKIIVGMAYTYLGLVLFLVGVNAGFLPVGNFIGAALGEKSYRAAIIPVAAILGYFVAAAEPAVQVLTGKVYEMTGGSIPEKAMRFSLMTGVGVAAGLAFLRIYFAVNVMYFLVPIYAIAVILTFFTPETFTAIAFDSGGVASGAMTASFMLPMALGFCESVGGNLGTDGFGLVAFVAATPLITIQIMGVIFKFKNRKVRKGEKQALPEENEIIE